MEFAVAVSENDHRSCRSHDRAAVAYIAAERKLPPVFTWGEVLSKWSIACAISNPPVDNCRRTAGEINTSTCRLLIQTTQTFSLPLRYPKMITAAVDLSRAAVAYIAAESILPLVSHGMKRCPSKWSLACAITKSAVDIGRRAAGQINTSTCRLLIQTTHTCSLPLRFPKMATTAEVYRMFKTLVRANRVFVVGRLYVQAQSTTRSSPLRCPHRRFRSCRRLPNSSSHRASPCPKGRSHLLDPRRISHSRIQHMPPMRQELGPAGHRRDGAGGPDGAGGSLTLHALPIAGHDVRRLVIGRVRRRRGKRYRDGRAA